MKPFHLAIILSSLLMSPAHANTHQLRQYRDPETQWLVVEAMHGDTVASLIPEAGCNLFSIVYRDTELLKQPGSIANVNGTGCGTPILYPTPNRVRNASFTFDDQTFHFPPNNGPNFIHGLVHNVPWTLQSVEHTPVQTEILCSLDFTPGSRRYELFPITHTIFMRVTIREGAVSWKYTVQNRSAEHRLPFGLGLHPWFLYQKGGRPQTLLTVPATHWMESEQMLPSGRLIPLEETELDARQKRTLEGFVIDDVYYGLAPDQPTIVQFPQNDLEVRFSASPEFKHLVVYTPAEQPWFCIENQTCSTDAHNLYQKGLTQESGLQIVLPGATASGEVTYSFGRCH